MWKPYINGFKAYLKLEKALSNNTLYAYVDDVEKLIKFLEINEIKLPPQKITSKHIHEFIFWIHEMGFLASSQARILSGLKNFYKYLIEEELIEENPLKLIDTPKIRRKLPVVLSTQEIEDMMGQIDR